MRRWGPIWRVLISPAPTCFTARCHGLHACTSSIKGWDAIFVWTSTSRARDQAVYAMFWSRSTQLEHQEPSLIHFRWMGGNCNPSSTNRGWNSRMQSSPQRYRTCMFEQVSVGYKPDQLDMSVWRSCKSSLYWCVRTCSPRKRLCWAHYQDRSMAAADVDRCLWLLLH